MKNGGWKTILSYWEGNSQGRAVKLREGNYYKYWWVYPPYHRKQQSQFTLPKTNSSPLKICQTPKRKFGQHSNHGSSKAKLLTSSLIFNRKKIHLQIVGYFSIVPCDFIWPKETYFTNLDFPETRGPISLYQLPFAVKTRVRSLCISSWVGNVWRISGWPSPFTTAVPPFPRDHPSQSRAPSPRQHLHEGRRRHGFMRWLRWCWCDTSGWCDVFFFLGGGRLLPSLQLTNSHFATENRPKRPQKREISTFQPSIFRCQLLLVLGGWRLICLSQVHPKG